MKKILISLLFLHLSIAAKLIDVDFDQGMGKGRIPAYAEFKKGMGFDRASKPKPASELMDFFRNLFNHHKPSMMIENGEFRIPPIVHIVWLGKEFPKQFKPWRQSWIHYHPDWTHILWVDNPQNYHLGTLPAKVETLYEDICNGVYKGKTLVIDVKHVFPLRNQIYYDKARNLGEKSDILRLEMVEKFGGLYVDVDFECKASFEQLHRCYDFYTGLQPISINAVVLGIALFASIPHHPVLQDYIANIANNSKHRLVIERTGPIAFTRSFWHSAGKNGLLDIAFPASYFYPTEYRDYADSDTFPSAEFIKRKMKPESLAVHHWAGSWT
ncbi:MAG TPA: glycosyltransferase [Candidatus Babeliales bacterium]|nr:glycosyltransferase [Candidatus Babeliales bacterium]